MINPYDKAHAEKVIARQVMVNLSIWLFSAEEGESRYLEFADDNFSVTASISGRRRNASWASFMSSCFMDEMVEDVHRGKVTYVMKRASHSPVDGWNTVFSEETIALYQLKADMESRCGW